MQCAVVTRRVAQRSGKNCCLTVPCVSRKTPKLTARRHIVLLSFLMYLHIVQ